MATITSPANGSRIQCSVTVSGTCSGNPVTVKILDTNGNKINGPAVNTDCHGGTFSVQYNICGVSANTEIYLHAEDAGGSSQIKVKVIQDCPACSAADAADP